MIVSETDLIKNLSFDCVDGLGLSHKLSFIIHQRVYKYIYKAVVEARKERTQEIRDWILSHKGDTITLVDFDLEFSSGEKE